MSITDYQWKVLESLKETHSSRMTALRLLSEELGRNPTDEELERKISVINTMIHRVKRKHISQRAEVNRMENLKKDPYIKDRLSEKARRKVKRLTMAEHIRGPR